MRVLIADGNKKRASQIYKHSACSDGKEIKKAGSVRKVIAYLKKTSCDVAFVGVDIPKFDWVSIVTNVREKSPDCNIIFVTDKGEVDQSCVKYRISGYLSQPITPEKINEELENLRYPFQKG